MNIDDSNQLVTLDAEGRATLPDASAVGFSIVPVTGTFPLKVVLDNAESAALVVESPGYLRDLPPFTKLEISEGQPGTVFKVRLLTSQEARESARFLASKSGHLLTAPAGAVVLFDINTSTEAGLKGWQGLVGLLAAEASSERQYRVDPATPTAFSDHPSTVPTGEALELPFIPGPTWDVSHAREVVLGLEVWGERVTGDGGVEARIPPPFTSLIPMLWLAEASGGATFDELRMGASEDFSNQTFSSIPYEGIHGVVSTGAPEATLTSKVRRVTRRARFARFGLALTRDPEVQPYNLINYFFYQGPYLRLFAYAVV